MLTDSKDPKTRNTNSPRRAVGAPTNKRWADSQKIEAVQTYLLLGNMRMTSHVLKIPEITLATWKRSEWWQNLTKEIQSQENIVLSNKVKKIVDKSLELVMDRLENGDSMYDQKTGKIIKKPVPLREVNKVALDMFTINSKIKTEEQVQIAEENISSKLEKLARSFEEFAEKQERPAIQVTDVVFVEEKQEEIPDEGETDAVHEEREEGL